MDITKSDGTSADDAKIKSDLFNLVENLRIELRVKDQELQVKDEKLANEKQEKQKLSADLEFEKDRANRFHTELAFAQATNAAYQRNLWKSFPSNSSCYNITIKVPTGLLGGDYQYLNVDKSAQLCLSDGPVCLPSKFKFTKNSNGTFLIYSINKGKYMQTNTNSSRVTFSATHNVGQFVIFFHPQNKQAGLSVDISTLDGYFLSMDNDDYVVANSRTPPADMNKFMIMPADEW